MTIVIRRISSIDEYVDIFIEKLKQYYCVIDIRSDILIQVLTLGKYCLISCNIGMLPVNRLVKLRS